MSEERKVLYAYSAAGSWNVGSRFCSCLKKDLLLHAKDDFNINTLDFNSIMINNNYLYIRKIRVHETNFILVYNNGDISISDMYYFTECYRVVKQFSSCFFQIEKRKKQQYKECICDGCNPRYYIKNLGAFAGSIYDKHISDVCNDGRDKQGVFNTLTEERKTLFNDVHVAYNSCKFNLHKSKVVNRISKFLQQKGYNIRTILPIYRYDYNTHFMFYLPSQLQKGGRLMQDYIHLTGYYAVLKNDITECMSQYEIEQEVHTEMTTYSSYYNDICEAILHNNKKYIL